MKTTPRGYRNEPNPNRDTCTAKRKTKLNATPSHYAAHSDAIDPHAHGQSDWHDAPSIVPTPCQTVPCHL